MEGILEVDVVVVVCALLIVEKKSSVALIIEIVFMSFILKLPDKGAALNQRNQTENCTLKIGSCDFPYKPLPMLLIYVNRWQTTPCIKFACFFNWKILIKTIEELENKRSIKQTVYILKEIVF
jgi:hypothetical protein